MFAEAKRRFDELGGFTWSLKAKRNAAWVGLVCATQAWINLFDLGLMLSK
ncbi:hypothetical protein V6259_11305 [Marinomonas sp. TI.3.20]